MNSAQIHLALNHVPLFCAIAGALVLAIGLFKKQETLKTLGLGILVIGGLFSIPVFLTGEGTEELVEKFPGVNEAAIERHEEMGKITIWIIAAGALAAMAGIIFRKNYPARRVLVGSALVISVISFGAMAQTAHLGGLIRHQELGNTLASAGDAQENENENGPGKSQEEDED